MRLNYQRMEEEVERDQGNTPGRFTVNPKTVGGFCGIVFLLMAAFLVIFVVTDSKSQSSTQTKLSGTSTPTTGRRTTTTTKTISTTTSRTTTTSIKTSVPTTMMTTTNTTKIAPTSMMTTTNTTKIAPTTMMTTTNTTKIAPTTMMTTTNTTKIQEPTITGTITTSMKIPLPTTMMTTTMTTTKRFPPFILRTTTRGRGYIIGRPFIIDHTSRTTKSQTCSSGTDESWNAVKIPLVLPSSPYDQEIGFYWLNQAEAEHASVASFARHTLHLMSIGAPSRLLIASQKAALDEIQHAKICYGFAGAFLGTRFEPGLLDVKGSLDGMDFNDIIRSLIIEGCIGETLAAIEAHFAAQMAQDVAIKAGLEQIASDETKHGQLAWDTIKWIVEKYPERQNFAEKVFGDELKRHIMLSRNSSSSLPILRCQESEKDASFRRHGLLLSGDRDKIHQAGIRDIIEPAYRAGFKHVNMISKQIIELDVINL